jgi:sterol desaturase/sphingolipid hydroxylase (fatty acid hydroxylase superfamily)
MTEYFVTAWETLARSVQALALPALIFAAIALAAGGADAIRKARNASGEVRTNAFLFVFDIIFIAPLLALMLGATGAAIQNAGLVARIDWATLPAWAVAVTAVLVGDFTGYWRHRLEHSAALWPTHAIHHSDTAMTWTTGLRFHPLNRVTTALIDTSVLALLGFPTWALIANNLVRHYYGLFIHMDLPWTYGPLGRVFVSPAMHRWHHIRDADGAGVNFATVTSIFDQAFGTYHVPGPCAAPLGVRDEIGRGAVAQLVWPFKAAYAWVLRPFTRGRTA